MSKTDYTAFSDVLTKYAATRMWKDLTRESRWLRDKFWFTDESYYLKRLSKKTVEYLAWSKKLIELDDLDNEITLKKLREFAAECGKHPECVIYDGNDYEGMRAEEWLTRPMTEEEIKDLEAEYELWKQAQVTKPKTIKWIRTKPLANGGEIQVDDT